MEYFTVDFLQFCSTTVKIFLFTKGKGVLQVKNSIKGCVMRFFCGISGVWKHSHRKRDYCGGNGGG